MQSSPLPEAPCWYVLNHIGPFRNHVGIKIDRFNSSNGTAIELFAPTYVVRVEGSGEVKFRNVNLTFHYVFVKGTLAEVKMLCSQANGFSFLIDHMSERDRYAVIPENKMIHFMNIARAYRNCLPYFSLDDIDLEDGDLVEVVNGDFRGLVGTFMPKSKSKSGNIVLSVYNKVGTIAFDVKATDVRILEYSSRSSRANDQIDAFMPHLLKALRHYDRDEALPTALAAKLSVFCGRMEAVRLDKRKLNARLQVMLYAANHIIGNTAESAKALESYHRVDDSVTNEWTKAANGLILSVVMRDKSGLASCYERLRALEATSKAQRMVVEEYEHYLKSGGIDKELPVDNLEVLQ